MPNCVLSIRGSHPKSSQDSYKTTLAAIGFMLYSATRIMLTTIDTQVFLAEAASAALARPCPHEPVVDGNRAGYARALVERWLR